MQITCLDPVFKNTQMWVYKSESCLGAISVPSWILAVLSVNTGDQGFTVRLLPALLSSVTEPEGRPSLGCWLLTTASRTR